MASNADIWANTIDSAMEVAGYPICKLVGLSKRERRAIEESYTSKGKDLPKEIPNVAVLSHRSSGAALELQKEVAEIDKKPLP